MCHYVGSLQIRSHIYINNIASIYMNTYQLIQLDQFKDVSIILLTSVTVVECLKQVCCYSEV